MVTTLPAPIKQRRPIFTLLEITAPEPITVPSPTSTNPDKTAPGLTQTKSPIFESINPFLKNTLNQSVNNAGKLVSYLEMPITDKYIENRLKKETDEDIINNLKEFYPRLNLKKVIFGHNLKGTKKGDSLLEYSYNIIPFKINDNVKLENSQF